jgi:hypothetical protein
MDDEGLCCRAAACLVGLIQTNGYRQTSTSAIRRVETGARIEMRTRFPGDPAAAYAVCA